METDERWKHNPRAGLRRVNVVRYKLTENVVVLFYPSYLRWMGDMALQKELQFECSNCGLKTVVGEMLANEARIV